MARSTMDKFMIMLEEIYDYRDTDPRRARYLRDRLYKSVLEEIAKASTNLSRDQMVSYARAAMQAEAIEISPMPRIPTR